MAEEFEDNHLGTGVPARNRAIRTVEKNAANGVAGLDGSGKLDASVLPTGTDTKKTKIAAGDTTEGFLNEKIVDSNSIVKLLAAGGGGEQTMQFVLKHKGILTALAQDIFFDTATGSTGYLTYDAEGIISSVHVGQGGGTSTSKRFAIFVLPDDFNSFPSDALSIASYRFGTPTSMTVSMFKVPSLPIDVGVDTKTLDAGVNAQSIVPTANDTFEQFNFTPSGTYSAGDIVAVFIDDAVGNGVYSEILSIKLKYSR